MAARRCKYVEYDWFPNGRWLIQSSWNHGLTLLHARVEIVGPNDPAIQVHVETVATAIDQLIDRAAGVASTKLALGGAALDAVGIKHAEASVEPPADASPAPG